SSQAFFQFSRSPAALLWSGRDFGEQVRCTDWSRSVVPCERCGHRRTRVQPDLLPNSTRSAWACARASRAAATRPLLDAWWGRASLPNPGPHALRTWEAITPALGDQQPFRSRTLSAVGGNRERSEPGFGDGGIQRRVL